MKVLETVDVVVVGTGNAASCAALAAREAGASVLMVDAVGEDDGGGNTAYAGGQMRTVLDGVEDIAQVVADLTDEETANTDFGTYTATEFQTATYARYGREVVAQPRLFAWQVFDQRAIPLLRDTYRIRQVTRMQGATLAELAARMEGVNAERFLQTMEVYNRATPRDEAPLVASVKDGLATRGISPPKSNWARRIGRGPFEAYALTAGITFTFGGLKITTATEVEDDAENRIPGLYTAGEMVGGLFYHTYPSGTGLTCGAVFGRTASRTAAGFARG